jgi:hypothetical protein
MAKKMFGITLDKHVSVGHIFTTVAAIFVGSGAYFTLVNDIENLKQADARIEKQVDTQRIEHRFALDRIDNKLDKIYDRLDQKADK